MVILMKLTGSLITELFGKAEIETQVFRLTSKMSFSKEAEKMYLLFAKG